MTEAEAVAVARGEAATRQWPWMEPVRAVRSRALLVGPVRWRVRSNSSARGRNVEVVVDDASGRVLEARFLPR